MKTMILHKKQSFSARVIILFLMLVSLSMFNLWATSAETELQLGDFDYTLDESAKTLTIDLYTGSAINGVLSIPSTYTIEGELYTVTAIGYVDNPKDVNKNGFRYFVEGDKNTPDNGVLGLTLDLTGIIFPSTLKVIGCYTFLNCPSLTSVIIPASVTTISIAAFNNCDALANITFEDESQLELIAKNAFNGSTFTLPSTRTGYSVVWKADDVVLQADELEVTPDAEVYTAVWTDESSLVPGTLTLKPNGGVGNEQTIVTNVGTELPLSVDVFTKDGYYLKGWAQTADGAIYSSNGTTYTPTTVSDVLFAVWEMIPADFTPEREFLNLSEVPYSISDTGTICTLQGYTGDATDIFIPSTYVIDGTTYPLVEIGKKTFQNKSTITNVILPPTLEVLGHTSFTKTGLDSIVIPASVETIVARAFKACPNLSKVVIEDESLLSSLGIEVFLDCPNLSSFTLPSIRAGYTAEWSDATAGNVLTNLVIQSTAFAPAYTAVWAEDTPTGIEKDSFVAKTLGISPNPVEQSFTLNVQPIATTIYNLSGKYVKQFSAGTSCFDVSSLESGMYFIKVQEADGRVSVEQLIKQ